MWLKACMNGAREPGSHPRLPLTPREVAVDAARVVAAGAEAVHVHPRGSDGAESLDDASVSAAVLAIREAMPGLAVGVTTGGWIEPDAMRRVQLISAWSERPDFASVNLCEDGAPQVAELLLDRDIEFEAGVWSAADAELLVSRGLAGRALRVMVECLEPPMARALDTLAACERVLDEAGVSAPRLLHGLDSTAWPLLRLALDRGYAVRIGLEDALVLPDGSPAPDNAALVGAARRLVDARELRDAGNARPGVVVAAHQARSSDPIRLVAGQPVRIGRRDDDWPAFVWCTGPDGRSGWVAERFLARSGDGWVATADYSAAELTVQVDDELTVTDEACGWVWATTGGGAQGWLPAEKVQLSAP